MLSTITPLRITGVRIDLSAWYALPDEHPLAGTIELGPVYAFLIALPGRRILVDAPSADFPPGEASLAAPALDGPPLVDQLAALGCSPASIDTVVITHPHFDHLNGLTTVVDGIERPVFGRAHHYLGAADWTPDRWHPAARRALTAVDAAGLLTRVGRRLDLGDGVYLVPTPGETPGHLAVHVKAGGVDAYITGDLFHHPLEFGEPARHVFWADAPTMRLSQQLIIGRAAATDALLYFSHIDGVFRVQEDGSAGKVNDEYGSGRS